LPHNTKFFWRMLAFNANGQYSTSAVWSFRTIIDPPLLLTPVNNALSVSRTPLLDWENVTGNTGYIMQVWKAGPTPTLIKSVTIATNVSEYQFLTSLSPNTAYFWRVQTKAINGPSLSSPSFHFTTGP
jgi:hypothetical protein